MPSNGRIGFAGNFYFNLTDTNRLDEDQPATNRIE